MSCPGAVQKPWLREIADTKNDGHIHRIKSRIQPPWVKIYTNHLITGQFLTHSFYYHWGANLKAALMKKTIDMVEPDPKYLVCVRIRWTIPVYFATVMQD